MRNEASSFRTPQVDTSASKPRCSAPSSLRRATTCAAHAATTLREREREYLCVRESIDGLNICVRRAESMRLSNGHDQNALSVARSSRLGKERRRAHRRKSASRRRKYALDKAAKVASEL